MRAKRNLWPFSSRATSPRQTMPASSRSASRHYAERTPAVREKSLEHKGYRIYGSDEAGWRTSLGGGDSLFDSEKDVKRFIDSWNRRNPSLRRKAEALESERRRLYQTLKGHDTLSVAARPLVKRIRAITRQIDRLSFQLAEGANPGPGAFQRCIEAVTAGGSAYDPRAVCAAAGRKKYGAKKFQAMARAGRKRAARGNQSRNWTVSDWKKDFYRQGFDAGRKDQSASHPLFEGGRLSDQAQHMASIAVDHWGFPGGKRTELKDAFERGYSDGERGKARKNLVDPTVAAMIGTEFSKLGDKLRKRAGRNPAEAAADMYQKFHGRLSGEVVEITKEVFYHGNLAALGELQKLTVRANDGAVVDLEGFKGAILCSNERGTQLYIEDGDQAVKLSAFGIGKPYHDIEDLGEVLKLWYFTTKDHLGDQGGEASYHHRLSEEGKVRMQQDFGQRRAPRPRLVYDTSNRALGFAGGEYTVEDEGIKN